jgi:hypothetical protein
LHICCQSVFDLLLDVHKIDPETVAGMYEKIARGEQVGLMARPSIEAIIAALGIIRSGAYATDKDLFALFPRYTVQ